MARKGDKGPYEPGNVDCITCRENHKDATKNGVHPKGENSKTAKLTNDQALEIYLCSGEEVHALARHYGISPRHIFSIKSKKIWRHLTKDLPPPEFIGISKGEKHGNARLTANTARKIYLAKGGLAEIGRKFGLDSTNVRRIKVRTAWATATEGLGPAPHIMGRGRRTDLMD